MWSWLDGDRFTAGDLRMATILRIKPDMSADFANLVAYRERSEARLAFKRALDAQLADFDAHPPVNAG